jgi:hypothetical protein
MKIQVTVTRTDSGAITKIKSENGELSKEYSSWTLALADAEKLGLINVVESTGAQLLPPGLPLRSNAEINYSVFDGQNFISGRTSPSQ